MQVATWNINSVKARIDVLVAWLKETQCDVVCLQELKCEDAAFPAAPIEELGYNLLVHGQKTYNGVAILSRHPLELVRTGLDGEDADMQARYIEAIVASGDEPLRIASIYLPNGNPVGTEKFEYKLRWMERLAAHARQLLSHEDTCILAGDFNVIPAPRDARNPDGWAQDALFLPETRQKFQSLVNQGWTDAIRHLHGPEAGLYSFWDYQAGAWPKNNGIRIDHQLMSPRALDRLEAVRIDKHVRGWEHPSDHVPVVTALRK